MATSAAIIARSPQGQRASTIPDPLPLVRPLVREILVSSRAYREMDPDGRRKLAAAMVRVCHMAASLLREEIQSGQQVQALSLSAGAAPPGADRAVPARQTTASAWPPLAVAQSAGSDFSGVAAARVAGTTRAILNAVSFPRFVTELINGVFKAMIDSSVQQMNNYVELLNNVSASLEGFAESNFGDDRARQWLAENFPGSFEIASDSGDDGGSQAERRLQLRAGAQMPSEAALRAGLGLSETDSVPSGDLERTLLPLARVQLARQRQQMLSTMVMLGMQRIVVESGKINAAMRFHIDTRSAAQADQGSTFSEQNQLNVAGSYGFGPWGVSASMTNTIGYVSTQRSQTTEEMNTDLDLNSSVEINFKSDYLPLNRLAGSDQVNRIRANTLNPEAEAQAAEQARTARETRAAASDQARRQALNQALTPLTPPPRPAASAPGTVEDAQRAQREAAQGGGGSAGTGTQASGAQAGSHSGASPSQTQAGPGPAARSPASQTPAQGQPPSAQANQGAASATTSSRPT